MFWATRTLVRELPYHDKSLDNATINVVTILVGYRCTMEWAWLRIHRALTLAELERAGARRDPSPPSVPPTSSPRPADRSRRRA